MDSVQFFGLWLAKTILMLSAFGAGIFVGAKIGAKSKVIWGWIAGLLTFLVVGVSLSFGVSAVDQRICQLDNLAEECD